MLEEEELVKELPMSFENMIELMIMSSRLTRALSMPADFVLLL